MQNVALGNGAGNRAIRQQAVIVDAFELAGNCCQLSDQPPKPQISERDPMQSTLLKGSLRQRNKVC